MSYIYIPGQVSMTLHSCISFMLSRHVKSWTGLVKRRVKNRLPICVGSVQDEIYQYTTTTYIGSWFDVEGSRIGTSWASCTLVMLELRRSPVFSERCVRT